MLEKHEIIHAENLLRVLSKATFNDMMTAEILAMRDAVYWLDGFVQDAKNPPELKKQETNPPDILDLDAAKKGKKK